KKPKIAVIGSTSFGLVGSCRWGARLYGSDGWGGGGFRAVLELWGGRGHPLRRPDRGRRRGFRAVLVDVLQPVLPTAVRLLEVHQHLPDLSPYFRQSLSEQQHADYQ